MHRAVARVAEWPVALRAAVVAGVALVAFAAGLAVARGGGPSVPTLLLVGTALLFGALGGLVAGVLSLQVKRQAHELAQAREARAKEAASAERERLAALGTLVAGVAHEINNPLTYLNGNLELAEDELRADAPDLGFVRQAIHTALTGAERIGSITKSLKTIGRRTHAARERVDVREVVRDVAQLVASSLPERVELDVEMPAEPAVVRGDAAELHRVVLNLVQNSADALREHGGHIAVRCERDDDEGIFVQVSDDGPGLPPEIQGRLFTPFLTTKSESAGLGLSVVQGIVASHGGHVEVDEKPSKGAAFRVWLPGVP